MKKPKVRKDDANWHARRRAASRSMPYSDKGRENHDRIFGKRKTS